VKVNQANILQLDGERLIRRTFDVIIRRRNYPIVPVKWYTTEGMPFLNIVTLQDCRLHKMQQANNCLNFMYHFYANEIKNKWHQWNLQHNLYYANVLIWLEVQVLIYLRTTLCTIRNQRTRYPKDYVLPNCLSEGGWRNSWRCQGDRGERARDTNNVSLSQHLFDQ
jgi:hypothetical protein